MPTESAAAFPSTPAPRNCPNESDTLSMNFSSHPHTQRQPLARPGTRRAAAAAHAGPRNSAAPPTATATSTTPAPHSSAARPPASATGAATANASTAASARKSNSTLTAIDDTQSALFTFSPRFSSAQYASSPNRAGSMSTNMFRASVTPNIRPRPGSGATPAPASNRR